MAKTRVKSISNGLVWLILILVFVGLGGYGAINFSRNVAVVGKVGDTPITISRYLADLNAQLQAAQAQIGQPIPMSLARGLGLDRQVLANLVGEISAENEAAALGLSVGDSQLAEALTSMAAFKGIDGKFDRSAYAFALDQRGQTAKDYEAQLRSELARGLLQHAITAGIAMPDSYADTLLDYLGERRSFSWAKVTEDNLTAPLRGATDADLQAWYDAHPADFTTPEVKKINYIALKPEDVAKTVPEDEAALRDIYENRKSDFVVPERRLVERLIFPVKADAEAALAAIAAGTKTFDQLVTDRKLTLEDVDQGEQTREDLGPAADAIFALTEPGVAGPVDIDLGAAIYRVNAILAASTTTFEDAKADLMPEYATQRARSLINEEIEGINNLLAEGLPLAEIAAKVNMEHGQIDYVAGSDQGLAAYQSFAEAASAVTAEDFPKVVGLEDGGIFAIELDTIVPPTLQPLADVREQVVEAWTLAEKRKEVQARADEIIAKLAAGETAEQLGITLIAEDPAKRDRFVEDLPEGTTDKVFAAKVGETFRHDAVVGAPLSVIVTVKEVLPVDPEDTVLAKVRGDLAIGTSQQLQNDILRAWAQSIQTTAGAQIDQATIDAILNQFN